MSCQAEESGILKQAMLFIALGLFVALAAALLYGDFRWKSCTRALRDRLAATRLPFEPKLCESGEPANPPAPIQRYFRAVLKNGPPIVAAARVEHTGTFNMGEAAG